MSENAQKPDFVMNPGERTTLLFTQMVFQLSSMAMLLLGKVPHPETGKTTRDLESAQMVIDQLDMLQTKTKGNLSAEEEKLLQQTLMSLRMAYVEAVNEPEPSEGVEQKKPEEASASGGPAAPQAGGGSDPASASAESAEPKKKFSKKY